MLLNRLFAIKKWAFLNGVISVLMLGLCCSAIADDAIKTMLPEAEIVGEGRLSFAFWDVYDATLYAPGGELRQNKPFVLSLRYLREINGKDIAERSVQEMRQQGFTDEAKLAEWKIKMNHIFPDVKDGTVLSAIFIPGEKTIFYQGKEPIGEVKDAEFSQWFFDIWLGEKTSEPLLRRQLLGIS